MSDYTDTPPPDGTGRKVAAHPVLGWGITSEELTRRVDAEGAKMKTVHETQTLHMMYVEALDKLDAMTQTATSAMNLYQRAKAERDDALVMLAAERAMPEGAPSEGWMPRGGALREWGKAYPDGTEGQVYADGRWWRGYRGVLPSWNQPGRRARTVAEGPEGLKRAAMIACDEATL